MTSSVNSRASSTVFSELEMLPEQTDPAGKMYLIVSCEFTSQANIAKLNALMTELHMDFTYTSNLMKYAQSQEFIKMMPTMSSVPVLPPVAPPVKQEESSVEEKPKDGVGPIAVEKSVLHDGDDIKVALIVPAVVNTKIEEGPVEVEASEAPDPGVVPVISPIPECSTERKAAEKEPEEQGSSQHLQPVVPDSTSSSPEPKTSEDAGTQVSRGNTESPKKNEDTPAPTSQAPKDISAERLSPDEREAWLALNQFGPQDRDGEDNNNQEEMEEEQPAAVNQQNLSTTKQDRVQNYVKEQNVLLKIPLIADEGDHEDVTMDSEGDSHRDTSTARQSPPPSEQTLFSKSDITENSDTTTNSTMPILDNETVGDMEAVNEDTESTVDTRPVSSDIPSGEDSLNHAVDTPSPPDYNLILQQAAPIPAEPQLPVIPTIRIHSAEPELTQQSSSDKGQPLTETPKMPQMLPLSLGGARLSNLQETADTDKAQSDALRFLKDSLHDFSESPGSVTILPPMRTHQETRQLEAVLKAKCAEKGIAFPPDLRDPVVAQTLGLEVRSAQSFNQPMDLSRVPMAQQMTGIPQQVHPFVRLDPMLRSPGQQMVAQPRALRAGLADRQSRKRNQSRNSDENKQQAVHPSPAAPAHPCGLNAEQVQIVIRRLAENRVPYDFCPLPNGPVWLPDSRRWATNEELMDLHVHHATNSYRQRIEEAMKRQQQLLAGKPPNQAGAPTAAQVPGDVPPNVHPTVVSPEHQRLPPQHLSPEVQAHMKQAHEQRMREHYEMMRIHQLQQQKAGVASPHGPQHRIHMVNNPAHQDPRIQALPQKMPARPVHPMYMQQGLPPGAPFVHPRGMVMVPPGSRVAVFQAPRSFPELQRHAAMMHQQQLQQQQQIQQLKMQQAQQAKQATTSVEPPTEVITIDNEDPYVPEKHVEEVETKPEMMAEVREGAREEEPIAKRRRLESLDPEQESGIEKSKDKASFDHGINKDDSSDRFTVKMTNPTDETPRSEKGTPVKESDAGPSSLSSRQFFPDDEESRMAREKRLNGPGPGRPKAKVRFTWTAEHKKVLKKYAEEFISKGLEVPVYVEQRIARELGVDLKKVEIYYGNQYKAISNHWKVQQQRIRK